MTKQDIFCPVMRELRGSYEGLTGEVLESLGIFSRDKATLQERLSVSRSFRPSVGGAYASLPSWSCIRPCFYAEYRMIVFASQGHIPNLGFQLQPNQYLNNR